jgi:hypothetical protein
MIILEQIQVIARLILQEGLVSGEASVIAVVVEEAQVVGIFLVSLHALILQDAPGAVVLTKDVILIQILHLVLLLKILGVEEIVHGSLQVQLARKIIAGKILFILMKQLVMLLLIANGKDQQLLDGVRLKIAGILMEIKQDAALQIQQ